jgi:acetyl-CoA acyltransferase 1
MPSLDDVVIVCAIRTPLCRSRKGGLKDVPASTLLSTVLKESLARTKLEGRDVEDICVGNVLAPPAGAAAWRMAALVAGFPDSTSISTCNRQCSSGLQAVANIANAIQAGDIRIGIGCGVESMTQTPMDKIKPPEVDWSVMKKSNQAMDCLIPMGITSENVCSEFGLNRMALDQFAVASHLKASKAQFFGKFDAEIVPVGDVNRDDGVRSDSKLEALSTLKPVFSATGLTTAGNSSQTTDGAAAVVLMTRREALKRQIPIMGVWRGYAVKGVPPRIMGIGPAVAIPAVLQKCKIRIEDVDVFEINEAFASQATWCISDLMIPIEKVNPNGGAISLGHPLGCTGSRQIATILHEMIREKHRFGIVSMCIGTGMGAAALIELELRSAI